MHKVTTADGDGVLVEGVEDLFAVAAHVYQLGVAEDAEVMGDGGLGDAGPGYNVANAKPLAAEQAHNVLAGLIRHCFGKGNRVHSSHIDNCLFDKDYTVYRPVVKGSVLGFAGR